MQSCRHDFQTHARSAWMRGETAKRGWTKFSEGLGGVGERGGKISDACGRATASLGSLSFGISSFADDLLAGLSQSARRRRLDRRRRERDRSERERRSGTEAAKPIQNVEKVGVKYGPLKDHVIATVKWGGEAASC